VRPGSTDWSGSSSLSPAESQPGEASALRSFGPAVLRSSATSAPRSFGQRGWLPIPISNPDTRPSGTNSRGLNQRKSFIYHETLSFPATRPASVMGDNCNPQLAP
jgi:hypothetical protein